MAAHGVGEAAGPLAHVKVLDFTQFLAGPFCTQILADLDADVIKVESTAGDMTRRVEPHFAGQNSAYFWSLNRGKRSVVLDLKHPHGRALALELARAADIVVENFRPGVMERLGLGYDELSAANPGLVYCAISGFGQTGPLREHPAYDAVVQAMAGTMSINGEPGRPPVIIGPPVGDIAAAMYGAIASLAALQKRADTGKGQYIDVAMLDSQLTLLSYHAAYYLLSGVVPVAQGRRHVSIPTYRSFVCADGADVFVTANTERMWQALCRVLGLEELTSDERFVTNADRLLNKEELWKILEEGFSTRPAEAWVTALTNAGVPAARINTVDRALAEPQVAARKMVVSAADSAGNEVGVIGNPIKLAGVASQQRPRVPELGEHTAEVLAEVLGLTPVEIDALREKGVVGLAPRPVGVANTR
jgi:CoA:oxalate CoA-transferase